MRVTSSGISSSPLVERPWLPWLERQLDGALEPWIQALSEHTHFSYERRSIKVSIETRSNPDVRVFEAIDLLALLSGIDEALFIRTVLLASLGRKKRGGCCQSGMVPGNSAHNEELPLSSWCERLVVGGIEGVSSAEYGRIRALVESAYAMVDAATPETELRVRRESLVVRTKVQDYRGGFEERMAQLTQVPTCP